MGERGALEIPLAPDPITFPIGRIWQRTYSAALPSSGGLEALLVVAPRPADLISTEGIDVMASRPRPGATGRSAPKNLRQERWYPPLNSLANHHQHRPCDGAVTLQRL